MTDPSHSAADASLTKRIAVVGGGIAGLAAAQRLLTLAPTAEVALFEASGRLGGVLRTDRVDGYLIERSADNFITNLPWGLELCRELGIESELLPTDPQRRKALVVSRGKLHPVPAGFQLLTPSQAWPLATSPLLSFGGKLRMAAEYFVPRRSPGLTDESLESFAVRRLGREAYERLVQPLVSGIFTADPRKLSMRAALPKFWEVEQRYGGLIRAARATGGDEKTSMREASGARYGMFVAPRDGMGRIVDALAAKFPAGSVRLNTPVARLRRDGELWQLTTSAGDAQAFDAVVVALPAPQAAKLLADVDAPLADDLGRIEYAGATIAISGYRLEQIANPLECFGFVVPDVEKRDILAASFSSRKFPGRAPEGCVLVRTFLGGALRRDLLEIDDAEVRRIVRRELGELIGAKGEPHLFEVARWNGAMPQYHVGHVDLVERIETRAAALPGLALVGNAYRGVGVPQCVHGARTAVERILGVKPSRGSKG